MYIDIYMAGYYYESLGHIGAERLASAMKSWHTRYGAEPYLTSGLTLRFVVQRPPTDVRDAFELASSSITSVEPRSRYANSPGS